MQTPPISALRHATLALVALLLLAGPVPAATFTVTTAADEFDTPSGTSLSLREAVRDAAAAAGDDTIAFAAALSGQTITVKPEIALGSNVAIDASSLPAGIIISGGGTNRVFHVPAGQTISLQALTLTGGTGAGATLSGFGGGVLNEGKLSLTRCTFTNNTTNNGGGVFNNNTGTLTAAACTFANNTVAIAGAGLSSSGSLSATQCTFFGNLANTGGGTFGGGAVNATAAATSLSLEHCTISGNSAAGAGGTGGGIRRVGGTVTITNCIVALNVALTAGTENLSGPVTQAGANLTSGDPQLAPLGSYGGQTKTMPPFAGSGAVNASTGSTVSTDQRGFPVFGVPDLGAAEGATVVGTLADENDPVLPGGAGLSLREAIGAAAGGTTVNFAANLNGSTFVLGGSPLLVNKNLSLDASTLASGITVSGNKASPVFKIDGTGPDGARVTLNRIAVRDGFNDGSHSSPGGGIINTGGKLTLIDATVTNCRSTDQSGGGGIGSTGNSETNLTLVGCTVADNTSNTQGGGVVTVGGTASLKETTLSDNVASDSGGGVWSSGTVFGFSNVTVANNRAGRGGGGIYSRSQGGGSAGAANLTNVTVSNNVAGGNGGGIACTSPLLLANVVAAGNRAPASNDILATVTTNTGGNLIGDGTGRGGQTNPSDQVGTTGAPIDARLAPLGDYGGAARTMPPLAGSPAINNGTATGSIPAADQRGFGRIGQADCGACEAGQAIFVSNTNDSGSGSLRAALASAAAIPHARILFNLPSSNNRIALSSGALSHGAQTTVLVDASRLVDANGNPRLEPDPARPTQQIEVGGVILDASGSSRVLQVLAGTFAGHSLTITGGNLNGGNGAGVYNQARMTLVAATVKNNSIAGRAAGIANLFGGRLALIDSTVSNNTATDLGGGIEFYLGSAELTNCTIADNTAATGAGFFAWDQTAVSLRHCTFTRNTATSPGAVGGIQSAANLLIDNCIVAANLASGPRDVALATAPTTSRRGANLIGVNTGAEAIFPAGNPNSNSDIVGSAAAPLDPLLGPLGNHGGPTPTCPLLGGSPAVDKGLAQGALPLADQRGLPRVLGDALDIGAFEAAAGDFSATGLTLYAKPATAVTGLQFEISTDPNFFATVSTRAGTGVAGFADGNAPNTQFIYPSDVALDAAGNLFVADHGNHRIRMIGPLGEVTTIAGSGQYGFLDGTGQDAQFAFPAGIAVGPDGNIYVSDTLNHAIRKLIRPAAAGGTWQVTTLAGFGLAGYLDGTGTSSLFDHPHGLKLDLDGNVYVADTFNHRIRKITPLGVVSTYAGTGTAGFIDNTDRRSARFTSPFAVALDAAGDLFVADRDNHRVRRIAAGGQVTTVAGAAAGFLDGTGTAARFRNPVGLTVDSAGNVLVVDQGNHAIRKLRRPVVASDPWQVSTVAGTGGAGFVDGNTSLTGARFDTPGGLDVASDGTIYVADQGNHRLRKIADPIKISAVTDRLDPDGQMFSASVDVTLLGLLPQTTYYFRPVTGNGPLPVAAQKFSIVAVPLVITRPATAISQLGATLNATVNPYGSPTTAGFDYSTDPGLLGPLAVRTLADTLGEPAGMAADANGNVYLADRAGHRILKLNPTGQMTVFAGTGTPGFADGPAATARFDRPADVALDANGNLYVADEWNHRIRMIDSTGTVSTVAGSGVAGFSDATPATAGKLLFPCAVALDNAGAIYIADCGNHRIRQISGGSLDTLAGTGDAGFEDGPATDARFSSPSGLAVNAAGTVYVADRDNHRIRIIGNNRSVETLAGSGDEGFLDGDAANARFAFPNDVAVDSQGNCYVADRGNHRLRLIDPSATVSTAAGAGVPGVLDSPSGAVLYPPTAARFSEPLHVACHPASGAVYLTESGSQRVRLLERGTVRSLSRGPLPVVIGGTGVIDIDATISDILLPGTTYYFRAAASNPQVTASGAILSFTTPTSPRIMLLTAAGNPLDRLDFGTTPLGTPVSLPVRITNLGQWPLEVTGHVSPSGFSATGGTGTVPAGGSRNLTITLQATAGGSPAGDVVVQSNDPTLASLSFPVSGIVLDPPAVTTEAATDVQPTSATLRASVNPQASATDAWFEYGTDAELDGVLVNTFAGSSAGYAEGSGPAVKLNQPTAVVLDAGGNAYVADTLNHRIRMIAPDGTSSTFAGTGTAGFADGPAGDAQFNEPTGLALAADGTLFVADSKNHRIRAVSPAGTVTTHCGLGAAGFTDGVAAAARFNLPWALAIDKQDGSLLVADRNNHRIRRIATDGTASTVAGTGVAGFQNGAAGQARFNLPHAVAVDAAGIIYLTEAGGYRLRRILADGTVETLAGAATAGFADGTGTVTRFSSPAGLAVDDSGRILLADLGNFRVRRVAPDGTTTTLAGSGTRGSEDGTGEQARFDSPQAVTVGHSGQVLVGERDTAVLRRIVSSNILVQAASDLQGTTVSQVTLPVTGLSSGTPYYFRAFATNGGGTTYGQIRKVEDLALTPFQQWQTANFGANANNPLIAGPDANPSGDGIGNLVKYAHGMNPNIPSVLGLPVVAVSGGSLTVTYAQALAATDLVYEYETSADLVNWSPATLGEVILGNDATTRRVRASLAIAPGVPRKFLRLRYVLQSIGTPPLPQ